MAAELREALPGAAGDQVFHRVGDVALHAEAALAPPDAEAPPAAAEFVAASTRFALVFFGDTLGAYPAAHARHVRSCRPVAHRSLTAPPLVRRLCFAQAFAASRSTSCCRTRRRTKRPALRASRAARAAPMRAGALRQAARR